MNTTAIRATAIDMARELIFAWAHRDEFDTDRIVATLGHFGASAEPGDIEYVSANDLTAIRIQLDAEAHLGDDSPMRAATLGYIAGVLDWLECRHRGLAAPARLDDAGRMWP